LEQLEALMDPPEDAPPTDMEIVFVEPRRRLCWMPRLVRFSKLASKEIPG
jgi:hypothetical protein